jgi:RimJ/RimL family protein N-acetyltransferase
MKRTLLTPRLKLTLVEEASRGTQEFEWMHELRSDEQTTWWRYNHPCLLDKSLYTYADSIHRQSKSPKDTERFLEVCLPSQGNPNAIRIAYAIHEILDDATTRFIGLVTIKSLLENNLPETNHLYPPSTLDFSTVLNLELAYQFLPVAWGRGFASESLASVFAACRASSDLWKPYKQVFLRAIVAAENTGSLGVMRKSGMKELGVHEWRGEKAWLAGEWRESLVMHIWGMWLLE